MTKLKTTLASFLLVSAMTLAEEVSSFQAEAVRELYNKGILKNVVEEDKFGEKDSFSRYEVASILYNTLKLQNGASLEGASESDILILKALVSDLALELGRLGAKDRELLVEIGKVEEKLDKKYSKEVERLEAKIDRIRLTSNFELAKTAYLEDLTAESKGFRDINISGEASAIVSFNEYAKGRIRYNFDKNEIDEIELTLKNDLLTIDTFVSEEIKLPTFKSTLGIIDGNDINSKDGVVLRTGFMGGDITALASSGYKEDQTEQYIYGLEYTSKIGYFSKNEGQDSNLYISYAHYDEENWNEDSKGILALGGDFQFKMNNIATQRFEVEYSKLRGNENKDGEGINYSFPIIQDEATYIYSKTEIRGSKYGKFTFSAGGINTGLHYDLGFTGNEEKNAFRETDVVKMESNKLGSVFNIDYQVKNIETDITYATYGSNYESDLAREKLSAEFAYKIPGNARLSFEYGLDRPEIMLAEYNEENGTSLTSLDKVEGFQYFMPKLRLNNLLTSSSENEFRFYAINNLDLDQNAWRLYADHTEFLSNNLSYKVVGTYEENYDYDFQNIGNGFDKFRLWEIGANLEKDFWLASEGQLENTLLIGGRYSDKTYLDKMANLANSNDNESYRVFAFIETEYGPFTLRYGGKYQDGKDFRDDENLNTEENFKYGASVEYEFNKDFRASLTYGPVDIYETNSSDDFLGDRTSAFDGEQEKVTFKIKGRL